MFWEIARLLLVAVPREVRRKRNIKIQSEREK